ncbi:MAG: FAD-binding oxidoreductase [Chloroflexota bacterium]
MNRYKTIVIGNGLIGSAAARYLSLWNPSVALIGPNEPVNQSQHQGVFSSHYDQGRLTRFHSQDPIWAVIAREATQVYPYLEEQSGVRFHGAVGRIHASRPGPAEKERLLTWIASVDPDGDQLHYFHKEEPSWKERFPFLNFPDDYDLFYEAAPAGYVNPREMLRAQNMIAQQHSAEIIAQQVIDVRSTADSVVLATKEGGQFAAEKVLIACGAFTNFNNLLPTPLPLRLKTESMAWGEVSSVTAAQLETMPGIGYDIEDPEIDDIYMAPPLLYPDGTYKIKLGCNTKSEQWPKTLAELQTWFQNGAGDRELPAMERALKSVLPNVDFLNVTGHRCIVTYTPSGYPTIDRAPGDTHGRLFVATGGNGTGAGGSDTLGKLAAGLVHDGRWPDELPRQPFLATNRWGESQRGLSKAQARAVEIG